MTATAAITIMLTAGGTGGHLFPAQAVAAELVRRGRQVALITDERGAAYVARDSYLTAHVVAAASPSGGGITARVRALADLARGTAEARLLMQALKPAVVVGFGGYASMPAMVAALSLRVPTCLHEQNAILGRVNRMLTPYVGAIAASFPGQPEPFPNLRPAIARKVTVTGNPVRDAMVAARAVGYSGLRAEGDIQLLVFGGSQGAKILSDSVPPALAILPPALQRRLAVTQQCRAEDMDRVAAIYRQAGIRAELVSFIGDMPQRLTRAHLVISRAGASTTSELTVVGRPAILAPYPFAIDDHQTANARALAEAGAAWFLPDQSLTPAALAKRLQQLLTHPERLIVAAAAAASLGRPDAARALADMVESLMPIAASRTPARWAFSRLSLSARRQEAA